MCYTGGFAVAAMANSQAMVDEFGTDLKKIKDTYWFTFSLTPCYLLTLTGNQWRDDLKDKATSLKRENGASKGALTWRILSGRELSLNGLQPGYQVSLIDVSGKRLYQTTVNEKQTVIDITSMKSGCAILTVTDKNKNILKRARISIIG